MKLVAGLSQMGRVFGSLTIVFGLLLGSAGYALDASAKPSKRRHEVSRESKQDRKETPKRTGSAKSQTGGVSTAAAGDPLIIKQAEASAAAKALVGSGINISSASCRGGQGARKIHYRR